jgi:hypothetical protein
MSKKNQGATVAQTGSQEPAPNQAQVGGEGATAPTPPAEDPKPPTPPETAAKSKRVRVICEGTLGSKLLEKGTITDHPEYVAILEQKGQKKVELVK